MKNHWKDEDVRRALRRLAQEAPEAGTFERAWFKIEERVVSRRRRFSLVWRPWVHPIRWVAAAACLALTFTGVLYHQDSTDGSDMAAYLMSISDPAAGVTRDPGMVHVSVLMSEPGNDDPEALKDQDSVNPVAGDEIFL